MSESTETDSIQFRVMTIKSDRQFGFTSTYVSSDLYPGTSMFLYFGISIDVIRLDDGTTI